MMRRVMVCLLLMCMLTLTARADVPGQTVAGMAERSAMLLASPSLQELNTAAQVQQDRDSVERQVLEIIGDGSFASPRAVYLLTRTEADASWPFETAEELVWRTGKTAWWDFLLPGDREENITSLVLAAADERIYASDMQGSGILVVLREGGAPYVIAWSAADGAAYARGNFLPDEELAVCGSAAALEKWLGSRGVRGVTIAEPVWDVQGGSKEVVDSGRRSALNTDAVLLLARRMGQAAVGMDDSLAPVMAAYENPPRLLLTGSAEANLLRMIVGVSTLRETAAVRSYYDRYYERLSVESLTICPESTPIAGTHDARSLNRDIRCTLTIADEAASGSGAALLIWDDAPPVAVYWYAENGAIRLEGWFLDMQMNACRSAAEVNLMLMKWWGANVPVVFAQ